MHPILELITGGKRSALEHTDEVTAEVMTNPDLIGPVLEGVIDNDDAPMRARAMHALADVARTRPDFLMDHSVTLLGPIAAIDQWEVRQALATLYPLLALTGKDESLALSHLGRTVDGPNGFARASALQAIHDILHSRPKKRKALIALLTQHAEQGPASLRARARKLLKGLSLR